MSTFKTNLNLNTSNASSDSIVYNKKDFRDVQYKKMFGNDFSKRNQKRFQKYLNSKQGAQDWENFELQESDRYLDALDTYLNKTHSKLNSELNKQKQDNQKLVETPTVMDVVNTNINQNISTKPQVPTVNHDEERKKFGFNSEYALMNWQLQHGLHPSGTMDEVTKNFYDALVKTNQQAQQQAQSERTVITEKPATQPIIKSFNFNDFATRYNLNYENIDGKQYLRYDPWGGGDFYIGTDGNIYEVEAFGNKSKTPITNVNGRTKRFKKAYQELQKMLQPYKNIPSNKKGGIMNKIKYFQSGGNVPQEQDMQQRLIQLVKAAMNGDQQATQTVSQIVEAAQSGDPKAAQLAQMIQQIAQELQQQAQSAKWGAKLSYLRSLKYAKGGNIPETSDKASKKSVTKVEEKACGGTAKSSKKRYLGGWL